MVAFLTISKTIAKAPLVKFWLTTHACRKISWVLWVKALKLILLRNSRIWADRSSVHCMRMASRDCHWGLRQKRNSFDISRLLSMSVRERVCESVRRRLEAPPSLIMDEIRVSSSILLLRERVCAYLLWGVDTHRDVAYLSEPPVITHREAIVAFILSRTAS